MDVSSGLNVRLCWPHLLLSAHLSLVSPASSLWHLESATPGLQLKSPWAPASEHSRACAWLMGVGGRQRLTSGIYFCRSRKLESTSVLAWQGREPRSPVLELQACSAVLGSGPSHACVVGTRPCRPQLLRSVLTGLVTPQSLWWELGCFTSV